MFQFIVRSTPSDELLQANRVLVGLNSKLVGLPTFVKINSTIFICASHPTLEEGKIALNAIQRRTTGTSIGAQVDVEYFGDEAPKLTTIQWTIRPIKIPPTAIDGKELIAQLHALYDGQIFVLNQQVGFEFDARFMAGHIGTMMTTRANRELVEVGHGMLTQDTEILIAIPADLPSFKINNIPMKSRSSNIIKADFDFARLGIGGLDDEFSRIFRRAFSSRIFPPSLIQELGITHVRGILLHGPPGTGKTLMARQIGRMLDCHEPVIVNGPELFNRYVGASEEAVRGLFRPAEEELAAVGADNSKLHLIILDEFDAMCRQRGSSRDSSHVQDSVVNQLLSKMDGVTALPNILLIAMTNRKDLLEEAILRPGRFEVHIEVSLPDEAGRLQIFSIHTAEMQKSKHLAEDVSLVELSQRTKNYTGAEIAGVVRAAASHAMNSRIDHRDIEKTRTMIRDSTHLLITRGDFNHALDEVRPQLGTQNEADLERYIRHGIIEYGGPSWAQLTALRSQIINDTKSERLCVLLEGERGTGKTALAIDIARRTGYPYVKLATSDDYVGFSEGQKCNLIRKIFDDAFRSPSACIILDDIERLIEYVKLGPRFSNTLLQAILVLCKRPPPKGHRLLVIGTTTMGEDIEVTSSFDIIANVMRLEGEQILNVLETLGFSFGKIILPPISIKNLILVTSLLNSTSTVEDFYNACRLIDSSRR